MTDKDIELQQQGLIQMMKEEVSRAKEMEINPSSFLHSVWFHPASGRFLFNDQHTRYEIIEPLIENRTLVFKQVGRHQGEYMIRYVLNDHSSINK